MPKPSKTATPEKATHPETIDGEKVIAVAQTKPETIYLLASGRFAVEVLGGWQTRTSLKAAQAVGKSKCERAPLNAVEITYQGLGKRNVKIVGKHARNLVKARDYGGTEQITRFQGDHFLYDEKLIKKYMACEEKHRNLIQPAENRLREMREVRDNELAAIRDEFTQITADNVDQLMAQAAKEKK